MDQRRKIQIFGILLLAFAVMYGISLIGHSPDDFKRITSDESVYGNPFSLPYSNPGGMMGAYLSYITLLFLGWPSYFMVIFLAVLALRIIGFDFGRRLLKHAAFLWALVFQLFLIADVAKVSGGTTSTENIPDGVGTLGQALLQGSVRLVGISGCYIFFIAFIACTLVYYAAISHRFRNAMAMLTRTIMAHLKFKPAPSPSEDEEDETIDDTPVAEKSGIMSKLSRLFVRKTENSDEDESKETISNINEDRIVLTQPAEPIPQESAKKRKVVLPRKSEPVSNDEVSTAGCQDYVMPGLELLSKADTVIAPYDEKELADTAKNLRETLETFGVGLSGNIDMFPGPVITRFEVKPAAGIKVNQIANLSDDLALNLKAKSIRIVAPIPGKAAVGIEIPNRNPQLVYLQDVLNSEKFQQHDFNLPIALGKDISGAPFVADLSVMPHLLISGTTGSGKSVCMNVIITSLIYALHPDNLRFIFIDPKMLELTVYKGVPFLDEDVVTNAKQAERVLADAVTEMEQRYRLLAGASVRSIVDYNVRQQNVREKLPYIVIVIDELADLMMSAHSSRVEMLITRLAQMARAVGIHLILATQRPSVDVITGLIKANFPSRIAFQVATKIDSRTILDGNGAERLLGRGDMLFLEAGLPEPMRIHGAFISSEETERIVTFIKGQPYSISKSEESKVVAEEKEQMRQFDDPVLLEAIETVVRQKQASVSLLQRKLGVGYQRAARLIDELEEMKIIGEYNESKAREVLVDKSFLDSIKNGKFNRT